MLIMPRQLLQPWSVCWMQWSVVVLGQACPAFWLFSVGWPCLQIWEILSVLSCSPLEWLSGFLCCLSSGCAEKQMWVVCNAQVLQTAVGLLPPSTFTSPNLLFLCLPHPPDPIISSLSAPAGALCKKKLFLVVECQVLMASKLAAALCCCIGCP